MKKSDIKDTVIQELEKVMAAIGATAPPYTDDMRPIGALPNFDSILAEDTTVDIFIRFGLPPDDDINPFFIKSKRACSLSEIVDTLHGLLMKAKV
jgi:hypothetical protein